VNKFFGNRLGKRVRDVLLVLGIFLLILLLFAFNLIQHHAPDQFALSEIFSADNIYSTSSLLLKVAIGYFAVIIIIFLIKRKKG
jgi:di/tricarboxylate transporter